MSRNKKILRNTLILSSLIIIFFIRSSLFFTPLSAYRANEKSLHYGPSKIIHINDMGSSKLIAGKYDKWFSMSEIKRSMLFFWRSDGMSLGHEIDKSKALNYTWRMTEGNFTFFGVINNKDINKIDVIINNDDVISSSEFYDDMFLFNLKDENKHMKRLDFKGIKAYDAEENIIFEEEYP